MVRGWPVEALIGASVGRLEEEVRAEVQAARPQTLLQGFELAGLVRKY